MKRNNQWIVVWLAFSVAIVGWSRGVAVGQVSGPLGRPGLGAIYRLQGNIHDRPPYEQENRLTVVCCELRLGSVACPARQWLQITFRRLNGQRYDLYLTLDRWPSFEDAPQVGRYLWQEPQWEQALEYVHEVSGRPVLPRLSLWRYGFPQASFSWISHPEQFPDRIQFQGYPFVRVRTYSGHSVHVPAAQLVALNPDTIVSAITQAVDVDGLPAEVLPEGKFRWKAATGADIHQFVEAGFNLIWSDVYPLIPVGPAWYGSVDNPVPPQQLDWLWQQGVYIRQLPIRDWPQILYRSNFWGVSHHIDEPASLNTGDFRPSDQGGPANSQRPPTPQQVAQALETRVRAMLHSHSQYGRIYLQEQVSQQFGVGNLALRETNYPFWDCVVEAAWYELAAGEGKHGIVDEDTPQGYVQRINMAYPCQIPPTAANLARIRRAYLRGAARNFNQRWGVAIYGRNPTELETVLWRQAYLSGASYFFFWTGWPVTGLPHVRDTQQRYFADLIYQLSKRHPDRDMEALLHAATVALVLPYGYTFGPDPMLGVRYFHDEWVNQQGVKLRKLLGNVAQEMERCLREGIEFDFAVNDPRFDPSGYKELIYFQEDGTILVVNDAGERILDQPRSAHRPDLGPGPSITARVVSIPQEVGQALVACAEPKPGAGLISVPTGLDAHPITGPKTTTVSWEVYRPDGWLDSYMFGEKLEYKVPKAGSYRVRAVTIDEYGRSAEDWLEFTVSPIIH